VSSHRREPAELAALLARKASNDATAVREFAGNSEISDEIVGFHAQQAVEKWLKAVMAIRDCRRAGPTTSTGSSSSSEAMVWSCPSSVSAATWPWIEARGPRPPRAVS
jgi:hypothetical protein